MRLRFLHFIKAAQKPKQVTAIHCLGHQMGNSQNLQGNYRANQEAMKAALMPINEMALIPHLTPSNIIPRYLTSEGNWARDRGRTKGTDGW